MLGICGGYQMLAARIWDELEAGTGLTPGLDLLPATVTFQAEKTLGAGSARILFRHILPHLTSTVIVYGTLGISTTVLLEATLSFLGVGVQPPDASWGNIIFENQTYFQAAPWLVFFPGGAILLVALAFNLVGDALRDALDPTEQGRD